LFTHKTHPHSWEGHALFFSVYRYHTRKYSYNFSTSGSSKPSLKSSRKSFTHWCTLMTSSEARHTRWCHKFHFSTKSPESYKLIVWRKPKSCIRLNFHKLFPASTRFSVNASEKWRFWSLGCVCVCVCVFTHAQEQAKHW
jgi:hypothetical protein